MSSSDIRPVVSAVALQFKLASSSNDGAERYTASEKNTGRNYSVSRAGGQDPAEEVWITSGSGSGEISKTANKAAAFMAAENDARIAMQKLLQAVRSAEAAQAAEQLRLEIEAEERKKADREEQAKDEDVLPGAEEVINETPVAGETPGDTAPPSTGVGETPPVDGGEEEEPTGDTGGSGGTGGTGGTGGSGGSGGGIIDILV